MHHDEASSFLYPLGKLWPAAIGYTFNLGVVGMALERFDLAALGAGIVTVGVAASTAIWQVGSARNKVRRDDDIRAAECRERQAAFDRDVKRSADEAALELERRRNDTLIALEREKLLLKKQENEINRDGNAAELAEVRKSLTLIVEQLRDARELAEAQRTIAEHSEQMSAELKESNAELKASLAASRKNQHDINDKMQELIIRHEDEKIDLKLAADQAAEDRHRALVAQLQAQINLLTDQVVSLKDSIVPKIDRNTDGVQAHSDRIGQIEGRLDQITSTS